MSTTTTTTTSSAKRMRVMRERNLKHRKLNRVFAFYDVHVFVVADREGNIWFKAVDLFRALDINKHVNQNVNEKLKKKYRKCFEDLSSNLAPAYVEYRNARYMHPKTTFVDEIGTKLCLAKLLSSYNNNNPKIEAFVEWLNSVVLPSVRRAFENGIIDPADDYNNREWYQWWTEYLRRRIDRLEDLNSGLLEDLIGLLKKSGIQNERAEICNENLELQNRIDGLCNEKLELQNRIEGLLNRNGELQNQNNRSGELIEFLKHRIEQIENLNNELQNDIKVLMKNIDRVFIMQPSCVDIRPSVFDNQLKKKYLVIYKKYKDDGAIPLDDPMEYYACNVSLDYSLEQRHHELCARYPDLQKLLHLPVPNFVNFFTYIVEKAPDFFERGTGIHKRSFRRKTIDEERMLNVIEILYRNVFGKTPPPRE